MNADKIMNLGRINNMNIIIKGDTQNTGKILKGFNPKRPMQQNQQNFQHSNPMRKFPYDMGGFKKGKMSPLDQPGGEF